MHMRKVIFFSLLLLVMAGDGVAKDLCLGARTLADVAVKTFKSDKKKGLSSMIRASKMCPKDKEISYNLGVMYYRYKRPDKAYEILAALAEESGSAKDAATVGWLAFKLGRYDLAEKWALKAGGKDKNSSRLRVECLYRKGKYREALKYVSARKGLLPGEDKKAAGYLAEQQWQLFRRGDKEQALQGMAELSHEFAKIPLFSEEVAKMAAALGDDSMIPLPEPLPDQVAGVPTVGTATFSEQNEVLDIRGAKQSMKTTDKAYAVIVGIRNYRNIKGPRYADNDARQMYNLLTRRAGFKNDSGHVKLLLNREATYGNIINALNWLDKKARLNPGAKIVFYFSGHGSPVLSADNKNFADGLLVPSEAILSGISGRTAISMKELDRQFGRIRNNNIIMIVDACFSGTKSATGLKLIVPKVKKSFFSAKKQVITASSSDRPAEEYSSGRQGAFSYFFIKAMLGEGDADGNGWVDTQEAFSYARSKLNALDLDQNPQITTKSKHKLCKVK
ncbi:hypothetical protein D0S45_02270 [Marinifilum sp. JC120]|nr:hypothetical protein D0S45_02270 [Marinifilum sp. JC120]